MIESIDSPCITILLFHEVVIAHDLHRLLKMTNKEFTEPDVFVAKDLRPRGSFLQEFFGEGGVDAILKEKGINRPKRTKLAIRQHQAPTPFIDLKAKPQMKTI